MRQAGRFRPIRRKVEVRPGLVLTFCYVPAGEADLGSPETDYSAEGEYVTATVPLRCKFTGFWIQEAPVSEAEYLHYLNSVGKSHYLGIRPSERPVASILLREAHALQSGLVPAFRRSMSGNTHSVVPMGDLFRGETMQADSRLRVQVGEWHLALRSLYGARLEFWVASERSMNSQARWWVSNTRMDKRASARSSRETPGVWRRFTLVDRLISCDRTVGLVPDLGVYSTNCLRSPRGAGRGSQKILRVSLSLKHS